MTRNATTRRLVVTGTSLVGALLLLVWFFAVPADGAMATTLSLEEMEGMLGGQTGCGDKKCGPRTCETNGCDDKWNQGCTITKVDGNGDGDTTDPEDYDWCYGRSTSNFDRCNDPPGKDDGWNCSSTSGEGCLEQLGGPPVNNTCPENACEGLESYCGNSVYTCKETVCTN